MIYCAVFCEKFNDVDIYIEFIKEIELFEEKSKIRFKIFEFFPNFLIHINTCESNFLLHNMIEHNILSPKDVKNCLYFVHYGLGDYKQNEENLLQNNCELHKKYIKAGVNPNEIVKIIRNDDIIELQEISSQTNFDFNQTIEPSLYERCEFINQKHVTLIDYAAFFSAVKCFKYLLMNGANVNKTGKYAIAGGNIEIIHLCEQNHMAFYGLYEAAIKYHKNDIFKYIYENKIEELYDLEKLGILCVLHHNYEIFSFLLGIGMDINENIIVKSAKIGNLFLIKHFLKENLIPKNILFSSIKSGNIELVQYILEQEGIDINSKNINLFYFELIFII